MKEWKPVPDSYWAHNSLLELLFKLEVISSRYAMNVMTSIYIDV